MTSQSEIRSALEKAQKYAVYHSAFPASRAQVALIVSLARDGADISIPKMLTSKGASMIIDALKSASARPAAPKLDDDGLSQGEAFDRF